jgi:hypothetical protein
MSITNQYGELRGSYLVGSKAQSQFAAALNAISTSLSTYGHQQPQLMFTDNLDDTAFLTWHFPSLSQDVMPVSEHARLPPFQIPDTVTILPVTSIHQIEVAVASILDALDAESPDQYLAVGLDAEWNVHHGSSAKSNTAVLQIAFGLRVFVFQVSF